MSREEMIQLIHKLAYHFGRQWYSPKLQADIMDEVQDLPLEFFSAEVEKIIKTRAKTNFVVLEEFVSLRTKFEARLKNEELKASEVKRNKWVDSGEEASSVFSRLYDGATNILDALKVEKERLKKR